MKVRILLLTFFYQPDLSAGSFRTAAMVQSWLKRRDVEAEIEVVTALPHRYHTFNSAAPESETVGRVSIRRIKLPAHKGFVDQALAFIHYGRQAHKYAASRKYDLVVGTSGRLMTAALSAWIARRVGAPLYLDIRDIFVENLQFLLPRSVEPLVRPLFVAIERWMINTAAHVNLVSRGFEPYFRSRYPNKPLSFFSNGVDEEFASEQLKPAAAPRSGQPLEVLYVGNIGEGQGLHLILPPLAKQLGARVRFTVVGEGSRRQELERLIERDGLSSISIVPPMERRELLERYRAADVLFLHLNDYPSFRRVLPSKVFEYAAVGKPIWAGVTGYCEQFLAEEVANTAIFPPCNVSRALEAFESLEVRDTPRPDFIAKYARARIMDAMAEDTFRYAGVAPRCLG